VLSELRREIIVDLVQANGSVTVRELCARFRTTQQTISRDLVILATRGQLRRIHGGAVRADALHAAVPRLTAPQAASTLAARRELATALEWLEAGDYLRAANGAAAACSSLLALHYGRANAAGQ
jgi:DeoR family fructose operon transcriptional repressor